MLHFQETQADLRQEMLYFSTSPEGKIVEVNELFLASCRYAKTEIIGKHLQDLIHKKSLEKEHCKSMLLAISEKKH
ncbi:PAS domain-containing protein [Marinomonas sp.]|uniref:PAS domain-containing protein n=1 Tax=Marinomonas sp. TaxID=1904862 RepID=UPI003A8E13DE